MKKLGWLWRCTKRFACLEIHVLGRKTLNKKNVLQLNVVVILSINVLILFNV